MSHWNVTSVEDGDIIFVIYYARWHRFCLVFAFLRKINDCDDDDDDDDDDDYDYDDYHSSVCC